MPEMESDCEKSLIPEHVFHGPKVFIYERFRFTEPEIESDCGSVLLIPYMT